MTGWGYLLQRLLFPALFVMTVAASAAAVLTLDRHGFLTLNPANYDNVAATETQISLRTDREPLQASAPSPRIVVALDPPIDAPPDDGAARLNVQALGQNAEIAFVPRHVLPLLPTLTEQPDHGGAKIASGWSLDAWTTETRRDVATVAPVGPRIAPPSAAERLPWRSAAAATASKMVTLTDRLAEISPGARKRLVAKFLAAGALFPPADVGLVAIKDKRVIELHARPQGGGDWQLIHQYPVLAASGADGPKLRQGDRQVPEGVYGISFLNPNSRYHVALRVNYPNAFDKRMAEKDGRKDLGGDIMIHGKAVSIGCLAIGDEAAEELFVLADMAGLENVKLVIAPTDFRRYGVPEVAAEKPKWLPGLYTEVASAMSEFKAPPSVGLMSFFGK